MPTKWSILAITRATVPLLVVLTLVELGGGLVLDSFEETLLQFPSLLVLVPVIIGTAGNLGSILASRLSTALHLGRLSFAPTDDILAGNALATMALSLTVFPVVGAGAWMLSAFVAETALALSTVLLVTTMSGVILAVLAIVITVIATYAAYRFGLDPDNVTIPVVTTVCDVLGVVILFIVVQVVV